MRRKLLLKTDTGSATARKTTVGKYRNRPKHHTSLHGLGGHLYARGFNIGKEIDGTARSQPVSANNAGVGPFHPSDQHPFVGNPMLMSNG